MEEQIGGPFFALTERHRDMKLSGFVDLIKIDVKNSSDPSKKAQPILRPYNWSSNENLIF